MKIEPFKGRTIDANRAVQVYRNLNSGLKYSIRQGGLVVAHSDRVTLKNCQFRVGKKGQQRVRASGVKNVHAYISGEIRQIKGVRFLTEKVEYHPYLHDSFVYSGSWEKIETSPKVLLDLAGIWV